MDKIVWFARGGGIARCGPFPNQVRAWQAMEYTDELKKKTRLDHPLDTSVWPEKERHGN